MDKAAHNHFMRDDNLHLFPLDKWQKTVDIIARLYKAPSVSIIQCVGGICQILIGSKKNCIPEDTGIRIGSTTELFCHEIISDKLPLYERDATNSSRWTSSDPSYGDQYSSYLGFPICWPNGESFGVICVMDHSRTNYDSDYYELMGYFRDLIQADLCLHEQLLHMQHQSLIEPMTGLLNRRGLEHFGKIRLNLAQRLERGVGVIFVDLDGLKQINDSFGHEVGDSFIRTTARLLQKNLREYDIAVRYGGDEFLILTIAESLHTIQQLVKRLQEVFRQEAQIDSAHCSLRISASIGYSFAANGDKRPIMELITKADEAMYSMKNAGGSGHRLQM